MSTDWLETSIDRVIGRARELRDALTAGIDFLEEARSETTTGDVPSIVNELYDRGGRDVRVVIGDAIGAYEHAAMHFRAGLVRYLVDEAGMTMTAVAQRAGVSRQMAARLYQAARRSDATPASLASKTAPDRRDRDLGPDPG